MCPVVEKKLHRKTVHGFLHGFLQVPTVSFPFADPVMCPLAILSPSHAYIYILSPTSLSSEPPDMWVVLGAFKTFLRNRNINITCL